MLVFGVVVPHQVGRRAKLGVSVNRHSTPTLIGAQFRPHLTTVPLVIADAIISEASKPTQD